MHRSGTSAVAGALSRSGVTLGERLIAAAADNPTGYFENADAVRVNEGLLDGLHRSWDDIRAMPEGWLTCPAAIDARASILNQVVEPLRAFPLWGLKDPRMCRVLPLWLEVLHGAAVEVAGVLVLRHPDEVAASLAHRDGMHPRAAHMLWLRHTLEAASAAPTKTVTVHFDRFVESPLRSIEAIGKSLGLRLGTGSSRLDEFVDPSARHHVAHVSEPVDEWHSLALEVYAKLDAPDWRGEINGFMSRMAVLDATGAEWIAALGCTARSAEVRRQSVNGRAIEAQQRAEILQGALDHANAVVARQEGDIARLAVALARAEDLVAERTREARELDTRLAKTLEALLQAESVASERTREAVELDLRLGKTLGALGFAETLARTRADEAARLDGRLVETLDALGRAESLVAERSQELLELDRTLKATAVALQRAEELVDERNIRIVESNHRLNEIAAALEHAESLAGERDVQLLEAQRQLTETSTALQRAEELVVERDSQVRELARRLDECEVALRRAEELVSERGHLVSEIDQRLGETQAAFQRAEELAHKRTAETVELGGQLAATQAALELAQGLATSRGSELDSLTARLGQTEAALRYAEQLASQRAQTVSSVESRLAETLEALSHVEQLALERAQHVGKLDSQLAETSRALVRVEDLLTQSRRHSAALEHQILVTQAAFSDAEALALERQRALIELTRECEQVHAAKHFAEQLAEQRLIELAALDRAKNYAESLVASFSAQVVELDTQLGSSRSALDAATALAAERLACLEATHDALMNSNARIDALEVFVSRIRASRLWPAYARVTGLSRTPDV